ncbi:MAG TPA: IS1182 family transposase [Terriglobia bacterium]|nr:IS1182 family transposase [Terriglobia bacterium]
MPDESEKGEREIWETNQAAAGSPPTGVSAEDREPRLKRVNREQMVLRAVDVEKLIEADHAARAIWELVGRLNLSQFRAAIESVEGEAGRPAFDPQLLISLWIYAYSEGVSSAREIERRCEYHPAYQWLTGLEAVNHHTLSDFRVQHQAALDELFAQVLGVLSSDGLIELERVMHDGTKVKALASGKSLRREARLREHLEHARARVRQMSEASPDEEERSTRQVKARERAARERQERLEQALREMQKVQAAPQSRTEPSERRVSETDPEARMMKHGDGGRALSHNVQISTDAAHSLIVGVSVTQSPNDEGQLPGAMDEVNRNLGRLPRQVVVDAGFTTRETILEMAERKVDLIGAMMEAGERSRPRRGIDPAFGRDAFVYDAERDTYRCPAGKELAHRGIQRYRVGVLYHLYRAQAKECRGCAFRAQCCSGAGARYILRSENVPVVAAFVEKMQTEAAQAIYRMRAAVAEFPNAWLKTKIGLRQFRVRGLKKARCEVLWACLAYNLQQWVRLRWREQPMPAPA